MNLDMDGRVYFVSGGSRGIGKRVVLQLLEEGAFVATCARGAEGIESLKTSVPADRGSRLYAFQADVLNADGMANSLQSVIERFGKIDGIVANAGAGATGTVLNTPSGTWMAQYEMKLLSVLNILHPVLQELKKSDAARVVIVNGVTADQPDPGMAAVSAARSALKQVAHMLAVSLAPDVLVNCVNIGAIATGRQKDRYKEAQSGISYSDWEKMEVERRGILLGKLGQPAEVAPFICLLLSPLSSYVTSSGIDISGGLGVR